MPKAGRKPSSSNTILVQLTLPIEVDRAIERLVHTGFYGRSKSEVVVNLLSREFERIARDGLVERLSDLVHKTS
jgi:Arc/MetJ-type ribon-helix-helix transcriptional regulator